MKYLKLVTAIVILMLFNTVLLAQKAESTSHIDTTSNIVFVQDYKIKALLEKHLEINAAAKTGGYRVKIHFGADKAFAYEVKKDFTEKYPDATAYVKYDQPNFNVRVGDFRTKLEAYKFFKEIEVDYPSSFIVKDEIQFPDQFSFTNVVFPMSASSY